MVLSNNIYQLPYLVKKLRVGLWKAPAPTFAKLIIFIDRFIAPILENLNEGLLMAGLYALSAMGRP